MTKKNYSLFRKTALAAVLALLAALTAATLTACGKTPLPEPSDRTAVYDMDIVYEGGSEVSLREEILYYNTTGGTLNEIRLHLYPNAFAEGAENPPFLENEKDEFYYNGESFGGIEVLQVKTDRETVEYELCGDDDDVLAVPCSLTDGEGITISLECAITLPQCNSRFGITQDTVNLTGFYPVVCVYENGGWRDDPYCAIGDPFYAETASFYVSLQTPENLSVASSGRVTESVTSGGVTTREIAAENIRDFGMCLSAEYEHASAAFSLGGREVTVHLYSLNDGAPQDTLALAVSVLNTFSDVYGAYPYSELTVAQSSIHAGGMEYGSFVIIDSSVTERASYEQTVIHEIAHQWWFGVVGSDQINAPWLDEGLTEFSTAYYYLLNGDEKTYNDTVTAARDFYRGYQNLPEEIGFDSSMTRPLYGYIANGEYVAVTYMKGLLLFDTLLQLNGRDKFNAALSYYYTENAYGIADASDLERAFDEKALDVDGIVKAYTEGSVII